MSARSSVIVCAAALGLAACQGAARQSAPIGQPVYQPPSGYAAQPTYTPPTGAVGSTAPPPAFDKNGNANYDANGTYIGGHGVGTTVDSPENKYGIPDVSVPTVSAPDLSGMKCTGSSGANAGTLNCTN
jgi:hypothetical protein